MFRQLYNLFVSKKFNGVIDLTPVEEKAIKQEPFAISKPYTISKKGMDFIRNWEKLELVSYPDTGGVWTIGYGRIAGVKKGMVTTKEEEEKHLQEYVRVQTKQLNALLACVNLISQNQFDAISSFAYNIGIDQFQKSTFLKLLKEHNWEKAANQLVRRDSKGIYHGWIYDDGRKIKGLINRRKAEKEMFLS